jgi:hypothetical protein
MEHSRLAPVEELHRSDENDCQPSKEDKNLVTVLVLGSIVCREQYHCWRLAESGGSKRNPSIRGTQSTQAYDTTFAIATSSCRRFGSPALSLTAQAYTSVLVVISSTMPE